MSMSYLFDEVMTYLEANGLFRTCFAGIYRSGWYMILHYCVCSVRVPTKSVALLFVVPTDLGSCACLQL